MKKAFTLLELVFVIVVIGILAAAIIPRSSSDSLQEAAIQLVSHIRYTQHLAMVDDRYNPNSVDSGTGLTKWYKERWQIRFTDGNIASDGKVAYAIYSDHVDNSSGHPEESELAVDPQTANLITGGITNGIPFDDDNLFAPANLGNKFGVGSITLSSSCKVGTSMRIAFDYLGRPMKGNLSGNTSSYDNVNNLIQSTCIITLGSPSEPSIEIHIEPETGYAHIVQI